MARAKQTARAEARRRHRAASRPVEVDAAEAGDADETPAAAAKRRAATPPARASVSGGIFGAFRQAYRSPNIREDLAALPRLLTGRWFLAALFLIALGIGVFELYPGYSGSVFLIQFLAYPPAIAPIFLAGFFAPRASYLLGLAVALFDGVVWIAFTASQPQAATGSAVVSDAGTYILAFSSWALTGIFFAAGAAWYRRFLQLTSPRRQPAGRGGQPNRGRQAATANRRR